MAVNKVVLNEETLIDLTGDTATAADVARGKTFHLANGEQATGTAETGGSVISINLSYGQMPPADTTKCWIKCNTPSKVEIIKTDAIGLNVTDGAENDKKQYDYIWFTDDYIGEIDYPVINTSSSTSRETTLYVRSKATGDSVGTARILNSSRNSDAYAVGGGIYIYVFNEYWYYSGSRQFTYYVLNKVNINTRQVEEIAKVYTETSSISDFILLGVNLQENYPIYHTRHTRNSNNNRIYVSETQYAIIPTDVIPKLAFMYDGNLYYGTSTVLYYYDFTLGQIFTYENPPTEFLGTTAGYSFQDGSKFYYYATNQLKCWDVLSNETTVIANLSAEDTAKKQVCPFAEGQIYVGNANVAYIVNLQYSVDAGTLNLAIHEGDYLLVSSDSFTLNSLPTYGYYGEAQNVGIRVSAYQYNSTSAKWINLSDGTEYSA